MDFGKIQITLIIVRKSLLLFEDLRIEKRPHVCDHVFFMNKVCWTFWFMCFCWRLPWSWYWHRKNGIQHQPDLFLKTTPISSKTIHGELSGQQLKSSQSQGVRCHWNDTAARMHLPELTFSCAVFWPMSFNTSPIIAFCCSLSCVSFWHFIFNCSSSLPAFSFKICQIKEQSYYFF